MITVTPPNAYAHMHANYPRVYLLFSLSLSHTVLGYTIVQ